MAYFLLGLPPSEYGEYCPPDIAQDVIDWRDSESLPIALAAAASIDDYPWYWRHRIKWFRWIESHPFTESLREKLRKHRES